MRKVFQTAQFTSKQEALQVSVWYLIVQEMHLTYKSQLLCCCYQVRALALFFLLESLWSWKETQMTTLARYSSCYLGVGVGGSLLHFIWGGAAHMFIPLPPIYQCHRNDNTCEHVKQEVVAFPYLSKAAVSSVNPYDSWCDLFWREQDKGKAFLQVTAIHSS